MDVQPRKPTGPTPASEVVSKVVKAMTRSHRLDVLTEMKQFIATNPQGRIFIIVDDTHTHTHTHICMLITHTHLTSHNTTRGYLSLHCSRQATARGLPTPRTVTVAGPAFVQPGYVACVCTPCLCVCICDEECLNRGNIICIYALDPRYTHFPFIPCHTVKSDDIASLVQQTQPTMQSGGSSHGHVALEHTPAFANLGREEQDVLRQVRACVRVCVCARFLRVPPSISRIYRYNDHARICKCALPHCNTSPQHTTCTLTTSRLRSSLCQSPKSHSCPPTSKPKSYRSNSNSRGPHRGWPCNNNHPERPGFIKQGYTFIVSTSQRRSPFTNVLPCPTLEREGGSDCVSLGRGVG
jgi:hypothetical protein